MNYVTVSLLTVNFSKCCYRLRAVSPFQLSPSRESKKKNIRADKKKKKKKKEPKKKKKKKKRDVNAPPGGNNIFSSLNFFDSLKRRDCSWSGAVIAGYAK